MVPIHLFGARPQNMTSCPAEYDISGEMPGGIWYNLIKNKAELQSQCVAAEAIRRCWRGRGQSRRACVLFCSLVW